MHSLLGFGFFAGLLCLALWLWWLPHDPSAY
jgi:hypothetical protein